MTACSDCLKAKPHLSGTRECVVVSTGASFIHENNFMLWKISSLEAAKIKAARSFLEALNVYQSWVLANSQEYLQAVCEENDSFCEGPVKLIRIHEGETHINELYGWVSTALREGFKISFVV